MKWSHPVTFAIIASGFLTALCRAEEANPGPSADELIEQVLKNPGNYEQMCQVQWLEPNIPIPLFRPVLLRERSLSGSNVELLRKDRKAVVDALIQRLKAINAFPDASNEAGANASQWNYTYCEIIVGMDAVETLPELLRLEKEYCDGIAKFKADPKLEVASLAGDFFRIEDGKENSKRSRHDEQVVQFALNQRELLSVILQLLRDQRYQPLLDSEFEKAYGVAVKANAKRRGWTSTNKKGEEYKFDLDPIEHVPIFYMGLSEPTIPYTTKRRLQARSLAERFLKTVPPEKWIVSKERPDWS